MTKVTLDGIAYYLDHMGADSDQQVALHKQCAALCLSAQRVIDELLVWRSGQQDEYSSEQRILKALAVHERIEKGQP